jgi:hypothetical protein
MIDEKALRVVKAKFKDNHDIIHAAIEAYESARPAPAMGELLDVLKKLSWINIGTIFTPEQENAERAAVFRAGAEYAFSQVNIIAQAALAAIKIDKCE